MSYDWIKFLIDYHKGEGNSNPFSFKHSSTFVVIVLCLCSQEGIINSIGFVYVYMHVSEERRVNGMIGKNKELVLELAVLEWTICKTE